MGQIVSLPLRYCRSHDGRFMVVASTDGYCTLVHFNSTELGIPLPDEQQTAEVSMKGEVEKEEMVKKPKSSNKSKSSAEDVEMIDKVSYFCN